MTRAVVTADQLDQVARDHLGRDYFQLKASCLRRDKLPVPEEIETALRTMAAPQQEAAKPPTKPQSANTSMIVPHKSGGYGAAALAGECAKVRAAPGGDRNNQLNKSAFRLGQLVARQLLARAEVERELWAAVLVHKTSADGAEWDRKQGGTLKRGLQAGVENPRATSPVGIIEGYTPPASAVHSTDGTQPGTRAGLPIIYYTDIGPALDAADFVEGVLTDGAMSVIYGDSNTGKTFFALDLALHVAAGRAWRGREVDRRGVLYLALEGAHGIKNRIAAFKQANEANAIDLPFAVIPVALNLLSPEGDTFRVIEAALDAAERLTLPVGLIVVDTLARAMAGGNENSPDDMGALVHHIDLIRQALAAHVCVIHHSGKDQARGARGHSSLRAATDTEIEVTRDTVGKTSTARVTKQREMELGDEFVFQLVPVELGMNRRGKPVVSCVVRATDQPTEEAVSTGAIIAEQNRNRREREKEEAQEAAVMLAIEAECVSQPGATRNAIQKATRFAWKKLGEVLDRMLAKGRIVKAEPFKRAVGKGAELEVTDGFKPAHRGHPDHPYGEPQE